MCLQSSGTQAGIIWGPLTNLVGSVLLPQALLEVGNDALIGTLVVVALHSLNSCLVHCLQNYQALSA